MKTQLTTAFDRVLGTTLAKAVQEFARLQAGSYSMAVALAGLLAIFPLIVGVLAIGGLLLPEASSQSQVYSSLASVFPTAARPEILGALHGVKHNVGLLGLIAIVGVLWTGTSLFVTMDFAFSRVLERPQRHPGHQRLMGLVMMLLFGLGVIAIAIANSLIAALENVGPVPLRLALGILIGTIFVSAMALAIYRLVPAKPGPVDTLWPGAVVSGVCIELLTLMFPLYVRVVHGFNTYGQQFALFFLLSAWMTLLCQFLLFGALFNKVRLGRQKIMRMPEG